MQEDQTRAIQEEARIAAEWVQTQRRLIAELASCAVETRARARKAFAQAQHVREHILARWTGLAPSSRHDGLP